MTVTTDESDHEYAYIQAKAFVLTSIALAPFIWQVAFNFGVYETVFYDEIFSIWAASMAALLAGLFVPSVKKELFLFSWSARLLLVLPTVLIAVEIVMYGSQKILLLRSVLALMVALFSLPYILYFIVVALVPGTEYQNSKRLRYGLLVIAVIIATIGFLVGRNHHYFLTCEQFEMAGNKVPNNCEAMSEMIKSRNK